MGSFGINRHAHVDAVVFSTFLTVLTYCVKWLLGFHFPDRILGLPPFVAIFLGYYLILFVFFLVAWSRK